MRKIIFCLVSLIFFSTCTPEKSKSNKNNFGSFICTIEAIHNNSSDCAGNLITHPIPVSYGKLKNSSLNEAENSLQGTVFLINKTSKCEAIEDFFPVAMAEIKSLKHTEFIILGMPVNPKFNPQEITDFFEFQLAHSGTMKSIQEWIELEYKQEWIVTSWEDDKKAKSYLDRLGIKF